MGDLNALQKRFAAQIKPPVGSPVGRTLGTWCGEASDGHEDHATD